MKQRKGLGFLGSLLLFIPLALSIMSCTKGNYDAFFRELSQTVPLDEVRYRLPAPKADTVITWYAPYKIFENKTEFARDSIYHQERFNWQGLGDFLWEKYQERKERKASKRQERLEQTYNNTSKDMKIIKDFLLALYGRSQDKLPVFATIDEWRNQVAQLKQESYKDYPIQFPALFFQVLPIDWTDYQNGAQQGDCTVRVHIAQENYTMSEASSLEVNEHLSRHDLSQKVYESLVGFEGVFFSKLKRTASELDEDPTDIIADTIDFLCVLTDGSEKEAEDMRYIWVNPDLIPSKTKYLESNG